MKTIIIDSSVIAKWLNQENEEHIEQADKILQDVKDGKIQLIAPELAKYEVGNVLLISKKLTTVEAAVSLKALYSLPTIFIVDSKELAAETYLQAHKYGITYYDASFISLAKKYNAVLVTANTKHQAKSSDIKIVSLQDYPL